MVCGGNVLHATASRAPVTVSKSTIPSSTMTEKAFMFAPLELTDDDSFLDHQGSTANLGEIALEIWRVIPGAPSDAYNIPIPDVRKVHERSKKALAHRVKLGDDVFAIQRPAISVRKIDRTPVAKFIFKYRSLDMLKANGIVPAPPKLVRAPQATAGVKREAEDQKPDIIDIEDEEIAVLQNRLNHLRSSRSTGGNSAKRVKTERKAPVPLVPGEVIDLTGD
ncbi:hypothetical protein HWV62_39704 [Athelia sp. TMB]|nr:hypothetical protein HWV62_39704 [Athelia sp. TMB]